MHAWIGRMGQRWGRSLPGLAVAGVVALATLAAPPPVPSMPRAPRAKQDRVALPVQRLERTPEGSTATLSSEHFEVVYSPLRLTAAQAEEARRLAEQGWVHCEKLFGTAPEGKIRLDLTPNFWGATGFARPGDPKSRNPKEMPLIGVRFPDLQYLGLNAQYVLTHEIGHIFSGKLASSALGEGIADWAASGFSGIPTSPWWGRELRQAGLWLDPEAFFITGEFEASPEVNALIRTAQYGESGLLVRFLVDRFGWEKVRAFAEEYGAARGRLESNADRRTMQLRGRPRSGQRDPRLPPDAAAVRSTFERHFGQSWNRLLSEWELAMANDPAPPALARRLVLGQSIYGAVRNYEMWLIGQRVGPSAETRSLVRETFTRANRLVAEGDFTGAAEALREARSLVDQLRRPRSVAWNRCAGSAGRGA